MRAFLRPGRAADLWWRAGVLAFVAAGAALRLWALTGRLGVLDSDEAVVGLMARDLLDGDARAFFWGQHYAGTVETGLVAAVFAVAGPSVAALKGVAVGLSAVACVLVWRVGRRIVDERAAQAAALFVWIAPASYIWWATKTRGLYWSGLVVGLSVWLVAVRLCESPRRRGWWALLGFLVGAGLWVSPMIGYAAVPATFWLLGRLGPRRLPWGSLWTAVPGATAGAVPWLWHNVEKGWAGLERPPAPEDASYATSLGRLLWRAVPMVLDLRVPISERWVLPWFPALYVGLGLALLAVVLRRRPRPALVLLSLGLFPFLYALFPGAWFVGEARYALFVAPPLALAGAWALRRPLSLLLTAAALTGLTVYGLRQLGAEGPRHLGPDIRALRGAGVDHAWADYWLAYRLTFESDTDIVATPRYSARHRPYVTAVSADTTPAFVFERGDPKLRRLESALDGLAVPHRRVRSRHLVTVVVEGRVDPDTLPAGALP